VDLIIERDLAFQGGSYLGFGIGKILT
jgi:hypothetical protein